MPALAHLMSTSNSLPVIKTSKSLRSQGNESTADSSVTGSKYSSYHALSKIFLTTLDFWACIIEKRNTW